MGVVWQEDGRTRTAIVGYYKKDDGSEPSVDELCKIWEDMDYNPLEDMIGSD